MVPSKPVPSVPAAVKASIRSQPIPLVRFDAHLTEEGWIQAEGLNRHIVAIGLKVGSEGGPLITVEGRCCILRVLFERS
jgi:hypothetical protein